MVLFEEINDDLVNANYKDVEEDNYMTTWMKVLPPPEPCATTPPFRGNNNVGLGRTSPCEVTSIAAENHLTLDDFTDQLSKLLRPENGCDNKSSSAVSAMHLAAKYSSEVDSLFRRLALSKVNGWDKYAFVDPLKPYTRNLVATDNESYTLLLLCWTPGKESPIHDHPCDGCWLRVLEGSVCESRYVKDENTDELKCIQSETFKEGGMAYINDYMGYHKMGNASSVKSAVTLHLYCPPIRTCNIWLDSQKASCPSRCNVCVYSEFGRRVTKQL